MEIEEIKILELPEVRRAIDENIERDSLQVALDRRIPHSREVATQVKYLQRAQRKLPSYYAAAAILPPKAFEQSSSEECATHKGFTGHTAVDLTCGLGVDSLYLSKSFERVIAIERDAALAEVAKLNFNKLGAKNIEVVNSSAEDYLHSMTQQADLIYIDPDRRNAEGKKIVLVEDCSPDIKALLPELRSKCRTLAVKLSPMFDTDEAFRLFGSNIVVDAVSLGGECKELLVTVSDSIACPTVRASVLGVGGFECAFRRQSEEPATFTADYSFLIVPDAALRKAGIEAEWCRSVGVEPFGMWGFCNTLPPTVLGKAYEIAELLPYQPKRLRTAVGKRIELLRHGFPYSSAEICKALGVKEGAGDRWAFAEIERKLWSIRLK